jgi:hypothetical protein
MRRDASDQSASICAHRSTYNSVLKHVIPVQRAYKGRSLTQCAHTAAAAAATTMHDAAAIDISMTSTLLSGLLQLLLAAANTLMAY